MRLLARAPLCALLLLAMAGCASGIPTADALAQGPSSWPRLEVGERGHNWLIRDGTYWGLIDELRVTGRGGWVPFLGGEMPPVFTGKGVALHHEQHEMMVALQPHDPHVLAAPMAEGVFESLGVEPIEHRLEVELLGRPLELRAGRGRSHVYVFGIVELETGGVYVLARYPASLDLRVADAVLREAFPGVERLDAIALEALRVELRHGDDDPDNAVGSNWVVRRGVYRNFVHDVTWTAPDDLWSIQPPPADSKTLFRASKGSLLAHLTGSQALAELDAEDWHHTVLGAAVNVGAELVGARRQVMVGPARAIVEMLETEGDRSHLAVLLASIVHDNFLAMLMIVGPTGVLGPAGAQNPGPTELDRALAGLAIGTGLEREYTRDDGRFVDIHAGFMVQPPARSEGSVAQPGFGQWSRVRSWFAGLESLTVVTLHWTGDREQLHAAQTQLTAYIERERGLTARPIAQTSPIELAGASGYHRRWDNGSMRDDVVVVNRDRTLYAIHVRGRGADLFEHSVASFEFVD